MPFSPDPGTSSSRDLGIRFDESRLVVDYADGRCLSIPLAWYPRLLHGTAAERNNWALLGDGCAIEWPELDEHIEVEGLLAGRKSSETAASIRRWPAGMVRGG